MSNNKLELKSRRVLLGITLTFFFLFLSFTLCATPKKLQVATIFSDHMVMQRNKKVPVWGSVRPGTSVKVTFLNQEKRIIADKLGNWKAILDPLAAGGPFRMSISTDDERISLKDILVGEVWLGSGQSNMEWSIYSPPHKKIVCDKQTRDFITQSDCSLIRISAITRDHLKTSDGGWVTLTPEVKSLLRP